ncbi:hypothetical protein C8Q75DRAFT_750038 [Abortiporus biennis]|nr:hypothetical protein C8Q75DRAFT_750038 [Abortiporus biennis]
MSVKRTSWRSGKNRIQSDPEEEEEDELVESEGEEVDVEGNEEEEEEPEEEEEEEEEDYRHAAKHPSGSQSKDELVEEEEEDEDLADEGSDIDALSPPPDEVEAEDVPTPQPRLKIKLKPLKFPMSAALSTANTGTSTPERPSRTTSRRGASREDLDIESEDDDDDLESTVSGSVATPGRALTARQAALANVAETTHVSLEEPPNPRKKKPLTELELALKREETARKRKNLSEKKLEDEKTETINRLLKRQSRAKGRRNALSTAEDRSTPQASSSNQNGVEDEEMGEGAYTPAPVIPAMYHWVSKIETIPPLQEGGVEEKKMVLNFSVPISVFGSAAANNAEAQPTPMDIDGNSPGQHLPPPVPNCDVAGCSERRKYRLVKDWQRGACGMGHLKLLESQMGSVV